MLHTGTAKNHLMTSCLLAIMLLIKKLFKNNTDTLPTGSGRRIKNALAIKTPNGHTCLRDFAKSLHANANGINVARTENKNQVIMQNSPVKGHNRHEMRPNRSTKAPPNFGQGREISRSLSHSLIRSDILDTMDGREGGSAGTHHQYSSTCNSSYHHH